MKWWPKRTKRSAPARARRDDGVQQYLSEFVNSRQGVEAYIEPKTMVTDTTLLLVAEDGEWTRRAVPSPQWAGDFAAKHGIPSYDAAVTGYPPRMREWNRRKRAERENVDIPDDLRDL